MLYKFTPQSSNAKTGAIPTTMTERASCPSVCVFRNNGCYAENFPLRLHWDRVADSGIDLDKLCASVEALPVGQLWRHNVAGDLDSNAGTIDNKALSKLVKANTGKHGFTYTHHKLTPDNVKALRKANKSGFTINASANNPAQATEYVKLGLPVVTTVDASFWTKSDSVKIDDVHIVRCPAETRDSVTCKDCGACAVSTRKSIIGFTAHGARKKNVSIIARG